MAIVLFDDQRRHVFLPLVYTKPVGKLRMGIMTMDQRWAKVTGHEVRFKSETYLEQLFEQPIGNEWHVNARLMPTKEIVDSLHHLNDGCALTFQGSVLVAKPIGDAPLIHQEYNASDPFILNHITDLFTRNEEVLKFDFDCFGLGGQHTLESCTLIGNRDQLYVHPSARVTGAMINTTAGPVFIDQDAEVMEGSMIRGPFYLGAHSQLKMGAKIYGATTIGPECKFGGEISNCVIQSFSNKAHDGFIGNSLIGEWCNLGADTNCSNLKNNYSDVQIFQYGTNEFVNTKLTFCGLIMGDHSKCGINTMFNTGTVVGVGANIFGSDFPEKHIPSFSWGGAAGWQEHELSKMLQTAERVYERRKLTLRPETVAMLTEVFHATSRYRLNASQSQ